MGNQQINKQQLYSTYEEWIQTCIPFVYQHKQHKYYGQLKNMDQNIQSQLDVYKFRRLHSKYLVDTLGIIINEDNHLCTHSSNFKIITEYIPYRFPDLGALSYKDSIYIMYQSMHGLNILRENYSLFALDEEMIGFTYEGNCKIWINLNFSSNKNQNNVFSTVRESIHQLLSIIQPKMDVSEGERAEYTKIKNKYSLKDFKSGITFVTQLKILNCLTQEYFIQLPIISELMSTCFKRNDSKFSLKMGLRKKYMKKSECDLNPEVMKENVSKNNLAVGSVTERQKKLSKFKEKKSKCFILKKNIKLAKNKFQPIHDNI